MTSVSPIWVALDFLSAQDQPCVWPLLCLVMVMCIWVYILVGNVQLGYKELQNTLNRPLFWIDYRQGKASLFV